MSEEQVKLLSKPEWTKAEDEKLSALVKEHGTKDWMQISSLMETRGEKPCAQRWYTVLKPSQQNISWSKEEDDKIIEWVRIHGESAWKGVKENFPGKNRIQIEFRWKSVLRSQVDEKCCERLKIQLKEIAGPDGNMQDDNVSASKEDQGKGEENGTEGDGVCLLKEKSEEEKAENYHTKSKVSKKEKAKCSKRGSKKRDLKYYSKSESEDYARLEKKIDALSENFERRIDKIELKVLRFIVDSGKDFKKITNEEFIRYENQFENMKRELLEIEGTRKTKNDRDSKSPSSKKLINFASKVESQPSKKNSRKRIHNGEANSAEITKPLNES